ncbi:MAG TPA: bifunctional glutamine-synthetase adenylyltransferase/deadenyltransferase, partial [Actinomycetota bacterium]|nr:bifunctional glutamine-synthetase adenylyltransferase/deadenyltransferase [Actinomycetota bacterium]
MVEQGSELSVLARFGIRDPARAVRELPSGWVEDPRWSALLEFVGDRAPDPDVALRRLCGTPPDIVEAVLSDPDKAAPMVAVLGFSEYLSGLVSRLPGAAGVLLGGDGPRQETLRDLKDERLLQIAARDLSSAPDRDSLVRTGHELSDLADDCLRAVIDQAGAEGMAVMAMGKLGGRELNYASDIDVLFVHRTGGDEAEAAAKRVMEAMNGPPVIFRTDADLRPEGRDGPLVRSLDAFAAYYRRWAQVWEFQSLIKCRFSAGDQSVGDDFLELVRPFVWPERLAPEAVEQVRALKSRAEAQVHRAGLSGRQVKLGRGGIRDVEFAVQLLQLVHGRHHPDLRVRNTLEALDVLGAEGFVAEQDADDLADAYVFLRHTEHRLQLISGRQTHTLPTQPARLEHVARGLGLRDSAEGSALDEFDGRWRHTTSVVRRIHERLFYRPLLEAFARTPAIGPALGAEEARDRLAALGFDRPQRAQDLIVSLTSGPSRSTRVMRAILPGLLAWLSETPDPDAGLVRLRDLVSRLESLPHLLAMLRDEPPVAELACRAVGTGPVLASLMQREPGLVA